MNKKFLGLLIAGVLAATSLPALSASAAEINHNKNVTIGATASSRTRVGKGTLLGGSTLYSAPSPGAVMGSTTTDRSVTVYHDSKAPASSSWYCVYLDGKYVYVYASDVELD